MEAVTVAKKDCTPLLTVTLVLSRWAFTSGYLYMYLDLLKVKIHLIML